LLAEDEKALLEEHELYVEQERDLELDVLRQKAAAVKSEKEAELKELANKKRIQQFRYK
jgi:hypothetical protein